MADDLSRSLRIAFCVYRGNPFSGGQGVYTKYITAALCDLGHKVTVFSGPPYPHLDERVELVKLPSLDLYREPDPFRVPKLTEFKSMFDLIEFALMSTGSFPEPRVFGYRAARQIRRRIGEFDVIHDNQSLNWSLLGLSFDNVPSVTSIHHPITVDRTLDIKGAKGMLAKLGARRWYGFVRFQCEVARRYESIITVSTASKNDMVTGMKLDPEKITVIPIGVDTTVFRPIDGITPIPHQIVTTASADVVLKGLKYLVEAVKILSINYPDVTLKVLGARKSNSEVHQLVKELGIGGHVEFVGKVTHEEMVRCYSTSQVACVPSVYEGFSLPAVEAMACGTPLVTTDGGALPEVVGENGVAGLIAKARNPESLADSISMIFDSSELGASLSHHGRLRVLANYSWKSAAIATVEQYNLAIARSKDPIPSPNVVKVNFNEPLHLEDATGEIS